MKSYKKTLAMTTSLIMALSMSVSGITAFASTGGSVTVNPPADSSSSSEAEAHTYAAYQIFTGTATDMSELQDGSDIVLSDIDWGTGFDGLLAYLQDAEKCSISGKFTDKTTAQQVAEVLAKFGSDDADARAFAKTVAAYIKDKGNIQASGTSNGRKITGLADGYYILIDETTGDVSAKSRGILLIAGGSIDPQVAEDKIVLPTLEKEVWDEIADKWTDANTASIGDTVLFHLTSEVPDMTGYDTYFFVVNDTFGSGFTFDPDSVTITIGKGVAGHNHTLTDPDDYRLYPTNGGFEIVFQEFAATWMEHAGEAIEITYSAVLNSGADLTQTGNPNTASLTYSNDPDATPSGDWDPDGSNYDPKEPYDPDKPDVPTDDDDDKYPGGKRPRDPNRPNPGTPGDSTDPSDSDVVGTTAPSKTVTYSTTVEILKTGEKNALLAGAEFQLTGASLNATLTTQGVMVKDSSDEAIYYLLTNGTYTTTAPTTETQDKYVSTTQKYKLYTTAEAGTAEIVYINAHGTSGADGKITFRGLGAGTYTITEISAPDGYNLLKDPLTLVIEATATSTGCRWSATLDSKEVTNIEQGDKNNTVAKITLEVNNKKGVNLPTTGSIGTKLFYLSGGILVACSAIYLVTKKRMRSAEI